MIFFKVEAQSNKFILESSKYIDNKLKNSTIQWIFKANYRLLTPSQSLYSSPYGIFYFCFMKRIAIFASGSGTNAENLVKYFRDHHGICCALLVCDNKNALVFERMRKYGIQSVLISKNDLINGEVEKILKHHNIDFIVLAGFLKLIPVSLIEKFPNSIINIHPSLLPKFGGKGMYGMKVHEAVVNAGETESGITIHYVNEKFDEGKIIAQYKFGISGEDTSQSIALKIHDLEMKWLPVEVEKLLMS